MNANEILEGNKLIAEFMGFSETFVRNYYGMKYDFDIPNGFTLIKETETSIEGEHCEILMEQDMCMVKDLIFHSSWDWLIPCVDKIYDINEYSEYKQTLGIFNGGIEINTKFISSTFKDVIIFIEWYNLNNK